jgi:putative aminopeptidase FrvX
LAGWDIETLTRDKELNRGNSHEGEKGRGQRAEVGVSISKKHPQRYYSERLFDSIETMARKTGLNYQATP